MPKKFCFCYSLKSGSLLSGTIAGGSCVLWFGFLLDEYITAGDMQKLQSIEVKLLFSVIGLIICLTEIFGVYMENEWLILPWLITCCIVLVTAPIILLKYSTSMILYVIAYIPCVYLWSCVFSYHQELSHQSEQNALICCLQKFCDGLYLFDIFCKPWLSMDAIENFRQETQNIFEK